MYGVAIAEEEEEEEEQAEEEEEEAAATGREAMQTVPSAPVAAPVVPDLAAPVVPDLVCVHFF